MEYLLISILLFCGKGTFFIQCVRVCVWMVGNPFPDARWLLNLEALIVNRACPNIYFVVFGPWKRNQKFNLARATGCLLLYCLAAARACTYVHNSFRRKRCETCSNCLHTYTQHSNMLACLFDCTFANRYPRGTYQHTHTHIMHTMCSWARQRQSCVRLGDTAVSIQGASAKTWCSEFYQFKNIKKTGLKLENKSF